MNPAQPPTQPRTTPPPSVPPPSTNVAPPADQAKVQLEYQGKVSDVWDAEVRQKGDDKDNKVVLVETDQGQVVLADLGPSERVKVDEGTRVTVTGQMMKVDGISRFVPQTIAVGKAMAAAPGNTQVKPQAAMPATRPQKQRVSGKIVDKEKMNAKETKIDHQLAVLEITPEQRVLVDLGPSDQLKAMELDEDDRVVVEGENTQVNETFVLIADKVEKGDKKVRIQRSALPTGKAGLNSQGLAPVPQPTK